MVLGLVAVDGPSGEALFIKQLHKLFCTVLGAAEHQRKVVAVLIHQLHQQVVLCSLGDIVNALRDLVRSLARSCHLYAARVVKICRGEFFHKFRHRGREQQRLAVFGQQRCNLAQRVDKAHVEHLVGFIEHQILRLAQHHCLLLQQVNQTARRGDQNICPPLQRFLLRIDRHATNDHVDLQMAAALEHFQVVTNLLCQLARRRKDQAAHAFRRGLAV